MDRKTYADDLSGIAIDPGLTPIRENDAKRCGTHIGSLCEGTIVYGYIDTSEKGYSLVSRDNPDPSAV